MARSAVRDLILKRVEQLGGEWPSDGELARQIGCHKDTVREARRWAEQQRVKGLKDPCDYCGEREKLEVGDSRACKACAEFLVDCQLLGELTRCLMMNRATTVGELEMRRARVALAAIVDEWVVRKNHVEVFGDPQIEPDSRAANSWFYDHVRDDDAICGRCNVRTATWERDDDVLGPYSRVCDECPRYEEHGYKRIASRSDEPGSP